MSWADCPQCGERVFTITAWSDLDRCPGCGRSLATEAKPALEERVREAIGKRPPERFERRRSARFTPRPAAADSDR